MKKLVTEKAGVLGPYENIAVLENCFECDGAWLPFTVVGNGTIEEWVGPIIPSQFQTKEQAKTVREDRNRRLAECDWTQLADSPADKEAWGTYRQALRDISAQAGFPWTVEWPKQP